MSPSSDVRAASCPRPLPVRGSVLFFRVRDAPLPSRAGIPGVKTAEKATPEQLANVGCLVRAVGGHQKISCMITAKEQKRFMQSYGNILKVSLDSLKKKEKKKADLGKSTKSLVHKST